MTRFLSRTFRKFALPLAFVASLSPMRDYSNNDHSSHRMETAYFVHVYGYEEKARINENFQMENYEHATTVAFSRPDQNEIAMPPLEKMEYRDGVHAWPFVLFHEETHIDIGPYGIHNESAINARARAKFGYSRDPFPSYPHV